MKNRVRNTSEDMKDKANLSGFAAEAMALGTSNAIERMEKAGQEQFAQSDILPTADTSKPETEAALKALGFELGGKVPGDDMFRYAKLPKGWTRKPTDHAMYTDILDAKGRKRAVVGYKAAFYDRWVTFYFVHRFDFRQDYDAPDTIIRGNVTDCGKVIHSFEMEKTKARNSWSAMDELKLKANAWLTAKYPDFNPHALYGWGDLTVTTVDGKPVFTAERTSS